MMNYKKIRAIMAHRQAFRQTEKSLTGNVSLQGWLHDLDKIVLLALGINAEKVSRLHRSYSRHHAQNGQIRDMRSAIIDWECARLTKADKPLNAVDTYLEYYDGIRGFWKAAARLGLVARPRVKEGV